jgi:hypothetical protein
MIRVIFSFVVDASPHFAYQGYQLARSILAHCRVDARAIHVHVTPEVNAAARAVFSDLGCRVVEIGRFGDGRYCNKIAQLAHLAPKDFDLAVLLDTDTLLTADILPHLRSDVFQGKIVDRPNPSTAALQELAACAGLPRLLDLVPTDAGAGETFAANYNGGFYVVPSGLVATIAKEWSRWALWLMENPEPLRREQREVHIDQTAMWLTLTANQLPTTAVPSNLNYYIHFAGEHRYYTPDIPICLLHYHDTINVLGLIAPPYPLDHAAAEAVATANAQIAREFDNSVFWDFRYGKYPKRGSGVGSRGAPLQYKRNLLEGEGLESAASVLDIGCGDLEVLHPFNLRQYLGLEVSQKAISVASARRSDWNFRLMSDDTETVPAAEFVLCLEVLIHQRDRASYLRVIELAATKTLSKLIVSGYERDDAQIQANHMTYYYEPLAVSLARTKRFRTIEEIGEHTSVKIYRCCV